MLLVICGLRDRLVTDLVLERLLDCLRRRFVTGDFMERLLNIWSIGLVKYLTLVFQLSKCMLASTHLANQS